MKTDLGIVGWGAVTPAGIGVEALWKSPPAPSSFSTLGDPKSCWPALRVDMKDPVLLRWQKEPRLRRASPLTFFMIEAAEQALCGSRDRPGTGLIVALATGCFAYSRRFFEGIVRQGQRTASPALFPETVFNSPGSHVAAVLGLNGAVYALVGDESAWIAALKTAAVWLRCGRVRQVLVMGVEEFDPLVLDAYRSARWLRRHGNGFIAAEGAAAVLVRPADAADKMRITQAVEGPVYRSRAQARNAAGTLLCGTDPALPCYRTAMHAWPEKLEHAALQGRREFSATTRPYLGSAFTGSAAWETLRAAEALPPGRGLVPIWGSNHRFGYLELERS